MSAARRKLVRAVAVVHVLAASALFAPWLANDLPIHVRGNSRALCAEQLGVLWEAQSIGDVAAVQRALARLSEETVDPADPLHAQLLVWRSELEGGAPALPGELRDSIASAVAEHRPDLALEGYRERLEELAPGLEDALEPALGLAPDDVLLDEFSGLLERWREALGADAAVGRLAAALVFARQLRAVSPERRVALLQEDTAGCANLRALLGDPPRIRARAAGEPWASLPQLRARTWWPVLQSLAPLEIFLMVAVLLDLLFRLSARAGWRPRAVVRWSAVAALAGVAVALHGALVEPLAARPDFRTAMLAGSFEHTACTYPPLPFSFGASHGEAPDLPPGGARPAAAPTAPGAHDPAAPHGSLRRHPLGTDAAGRDVLARLLWGGRISLGVGMLCATLVGILGILIGSIAGFFRGWVDALVQRLIEVVMCFPTLFLVIAVVAASYGAEGQEGLDSVPIWNVMIVIALVRWTLVARLVRAEVLRVRELDFILAARASGIGTPRLVLRHVLPHALSPVWIALAFEVAAAMLIEAALSFLGFGIREPMASWGYVLRGAFEDPWRWWIVVFPGLLILVAVSCYNLIGEALAELMDPRRRRGPRDASSHV